MKRLLMALLVVSALFGASLQAKAGKKYICAIGNQGDMPFILRYDTKAECNKLCPHGACEETSVENVLSVDPKIYDADAE